MRASSAGFFARGGADAAEDGGERDVVLDGDERVAGSPVGDLADHARDVHLGGAEAVAVGTANFVNPRATTDIIDGIEAFLVARNIEKIANIIGTLET